MRTLDLGAFTLLFTALVACAPAVQMGLPTAPPHPTLEFAATANPTVVANGDVVQLVNSLRERGITLENPDDSPAAFPFPVPGISYRVGRGWLALHPLPSTQAAERRAMEIPPQLTPSIIDWVDQPHFYRCGSILALYLGRAANVVQTLTDICGPEFAGWP